MATTITNMYHNPSVEVDVVRWSSDAGTARSLSTEWAWSGSASVKLVNDGSAAGGLIAQAGYYDPAITQGQAVTLGAALAGTGTVYFRVMEYNAAGSYLSQRTEYGSIALTPAGAYHRVVHTGIHADVAKLRLNIRVPSAGTPTTFYADAFLAVAGDYDGPYFDGGSPGAVWTGTPHASTSVLTIPDTRTVHPVLQIGSSHVGPLRVGKD
jgi:hypothetical protein